MDAIRIRGARTHTLKNISIDLPRHRLVVLTGLSGSGKSSLAFDTLYAEGQRRYVESLSAYARQFLQLMEKPDVDLIEGLSPAISIEQKAAGSNPRSTVGTITEIHDYLRLLYARAGTPFCPEHGLALQSHSVSQMVDALMARPAGNRFAILAPQTAGDGTERAGAIRQLQAQGFVRIRVEGQLIALEGGELPELPADGRFEVVVDRLRIREAARQRLAESLETALRLADGRVVALDLDQEEALSFSLHYACPVCQYTLAELEPRLFSFNNPMGACPGCDGLGRQDVFDPRRVVAFPELGLAGGAVVGWDRRNAFTATLINSLAAHYGFDIDAPFESLPEMVRQHLLYGSGTEEIAFLYLGEEGRSTVKKHPFEGIIPNLERRWRETDSVAVREELNKLRHSQPCEECQGSRLRREARHVFLGTDRQPIYAVEALPLDACQQWFARLQLEGARKVVADRIVREISARLQFLNNVGLNYLSLDRGADTLSGGESQRIRLASQIGSGLTGVMYVLDEPSIGLHQRDSHRLIKTLQDLRDLGNSVIVVEHDEDMIRAADFVVDMGPGAGEHGGRIVASGTPEDIMACPDSLTGQYLSGKRRIAMPARRPVDETQESLTISGCRGHNLKGVALSIPVGRLSCVTGVSGSGKSTLVNETLARALAQRLHRSQAEPAPFDTLSGVAHFDKLVDVNQSPIGRTPRSNPATYTGLFTPIRELFAGVPEARARGYDPGRFSFNVRGGRCEACQGDGVLRVAMHFLPDVYVPCDVCHGRRYNRETLEIRYRGHSIADVLDLTVAQAMDCFQAIPGVARRLQTLMEVGLSYLRLGQSATTLSGGEAQRIKLSLELSRRGTGRTLYILDEPTTGLHFHDIALLLDVLGRLVDAGNTVVVIEHNMDVLRAADWIVDLGPEGGTGGGEIIAQGTPEFIATQAHSHTGRHLALHLDHITKR